jgi:uncharacterized protein (DUF302 family)
MTGGFVTRTTRLRPDDVAEGLALSPTEVILFGNPRVGTPIMQGSRTIGLDLPLRALVTEDADGATDPGAMAERHGMSTASNRAVDGMRGALDAVTREAAGKGAS